MLQKTLKIRSFYTILGIKVATIATAIISAYVSPPLTRMMPSTPDYELGLLRVCPNSTGIIAH
jgi:hypothetical protein